MNFIVYFYYNDNNDLIYVGKTQKNPITRHLQHKKDKWIKEAQRIGIREYEKKNQMDMAERYYIDAYKPKYNTALKTKDTIEKDDKIRIVDDTTESLYTIDEFEALFCLIDEGSCKQGSSENHKLPAKVKKIRNYHISMHKKNPNIIIIDEPNISNISMMFMHEGLTLQLGNAYFSAMSDKHSKKPLTEPSNLIKRFLSAWISASDCENQFVMFAVRLDNLKEYVVPSICTNYITEDGNRQYSWKTLGSATITVNKKACAAMYVLPSVKTLMEYMKTKDETLIDYYEKRDADSAEDR